MPLKKQPENAENDDFFSRKERDLRSLLRKLEKKELMQNNTEENVYLREKLEQGVRPKHIYRSSFY